MTNLRNLNQTHPFWDFVNAMQNGNNNSNDNGRGQQDQRDVRFAEGPWNRGSWGYNNNNNSTPGGFPQSANIPVREEKPFTSSGEKDEKNMTPETADPMDGGIGDEDFDPPVEVPEDNEDEEDSPAEAPANGTQPHSRHHRRGHGQRSRSRHRQERREAREARREQHEQQKQHRRGGPGRGGSRGGPFGFAFGGRGSHNFPCGGLRGFGPGPHHHHRGGPPPPGGPHGMPFDLPAWASWVQTNFIDPYVGNNSTNNNSNNASGRNFPFFNNNNNNNDQDFTPAIDIFSTGEAFVVHVSLPGAAKEDIAVNWETETSTLVVSGIIHRPGDEELLSAIEVSERQAGAFERRVVLGTRTEPAHVDQDSIAAKLQDGVLRVEVPKIQKEEGYVEIRKVDIQ